MAIHKRNNSGYIIGDAANSGVIDPFTDPVVGKQGIHIYQDTRYYEYTGGWSIPIGLNPRFHVTGNVSGTGISKDMSGGIGSHNFQYHPNSTGSKSGYYLSDWGNDIWDAWGYFGLSYFDFGYRTQVDHEYIRFNSGRNAADGVFTTDSWTSANGNFTWYVKHGFPVANVWMFKVWNNNGQDFQIATGGNMGSDGNTFTRDSYTDVTLNTGQTLRLRFRENADNGSFNSNEQVRWYFLPTGQFATNTYGSGTSTNTFHNAYVSGDNHYIYSNSHTEQVLYMTKGSDISGSSAWVGDDLTLV